MDEFDCVFLVVFSTSWPTNVVACEMSATGLVIFVPISFAYYVGRKVIVGSTVDAGGVLFIC